MESEREGESASATDLHEARQQSQAAPEQSEHLRHKQRDHILPSRVDRVESGDRGCQRIQRWEWSLGERESAKGASDAGLRAMAWSIPPAPVPQPALGESDRRAARAVARQRGKTAADTKSAGWGSKTNGDEARLAPPRHHFRGCAHATADCRQARHSPCVARGRRACVWCWGVCAPVGPKRRLALASVPGSCGWPPRESPVRHGPASRSGRVRVGTVGRVRQTRDCNCLSCESTAPMSQSPHPRDATRHSKASDHVNVRPRPAPTPHRSATDRGSCAASPPPHPCCE
jgi:hypothetical protein